MQTVSDSHRTHIETYLVDSVQHVYTEHPNTKPASLSAITIKLRQRNQNVRICAIPKYQTCTRTRRYSPMLRSKIPRAITGAIDQKTFQNKRYVYSKTLQTSQLSSQQTQPSHSLCCTPPAVNLEPPKHANTHDILEEKVHNPKQPLSAPLQALKS
jgi:hypothetical protein